MKKKSMLLGLLLSIGSLAFSMSATDPEILKIPTLKVLSEKVEAGRKKVHDAQSSSRAAAQAAQAELTAAYNEYAAELKKQKALTTDNNLKTVIDKELQTIDGTLKQQAPTNNK